jgi:hypothetical protein
MSTSSPLRQQVARRHSISSNWASPVTHPGYTFGKSKRIDESQLKRTSSMSPGPIYQGHAIHNNITKKSYSIPRGRRTNILDQVTAVSPGPAAHNSPVARAKSPSYSIGRTKRFIADEIKHKETRLTPGPGTYTTEPNDNAASNDSPAFSFGSKKLVDKRFFSDKLDFKGPNLDSPGPIYDVNKLTKAANAGPSYSFPKGKKGHPCMCHK